jgi:hypothetical protein
MGVYFYFRRSHFRNKLKRSPNSAEKQQADRILFGYGGDRFCKGSRIGGAITHQEKAFAMAILSHS